MVQPARRRRSQAGPELPGNRAPTSTPRAPSEEGALDPSFVITHILPLRSAPDAYRMFLDKADGCVKVVLRP